MYLVARTIQEFSLVGLLTGTSMMPRRFSLYTVRSERYPPRSHGEYGDLYSVLAAALNVPTLD